jgi:DNA-binding transcriptional ArsR family regulator
MRLEGAVPVFAALGDETRLRLVTRLCGSGPLSITQLASDATVSRQAITKHLKVMKDAGLVRENRRGRECIWELDKKRLEIAQKYLTQISSHWDDALGRLRDLVEK